MSGGQVPYHLRTNKAVDRHAFIDLLLRVHGYISIAKFTYVGFGGPFLEDFRMIHSTFGATRLVSIEIDKGVWNRQRFNRPHSHIKRLLTSSGDFIANYNSSRNAIIWLDYAASDERREQLLELQMLLPRLRHNDIVKITINANPDTLGSGNQPIADRVARRRQSLTSKIGDFLPNHVADDELLSPPGFARLLYGAVRRVLSDSLSGTVNTDIVPLTAFRYADGPHSMVTMTGVVLPKNKGPQFLKKTGIGSWDLFIGEQPDPIPIDVPVLSVRERLFVDSRLPTQKGDKISRALGFQIGDDPEKWAAMLDSYARFYRHLPYFSRVVP
jgi:hypothetical protein